MNKKYYLAYGSNLNLKQMESRCPSAELVGYTVLENTRLIFRGSGSGSYLSIEPALPETTRSVPCGVFRITAMDEQRLDVYEGYPRFYQKIRYKNLPLFSMDGELLKGNLTAMAYVLPVTAPLGFPSRQYVQTCNEGYDDFRFTWSHIEQAIQDTLSGIACGI